MGRSIKGSKHAAFNHHSREFNTRARDHEDPGIGIGSLTVAINVIDRTITRHRHYLAAVLSLLLSIYVAVMWLWSKLSRLGYRLLTIRMKDELIIILINILIRSNHSIGVTLFNSGSTPSWSSFIEYWLITEIKEDTKDTIRGLYF